MGSQIVPFGGSQTLDPKGPGVSDPPIQGLRSRDPKISGSGSTDSRVPTCQIWRSQGLDPWIPGLGTLFQRGIRLWESVSTWNRLQSTRSEGLKPSDLQSQALNMVRNHSKRGESTMSRVLGQLHFPITRVGTLGMETSRPGI
jgi:hypothetical protein